MGRWKNIEGNGAVCFEADGSVRIVVSDEISELVDEAERAGISADEVMNRLLDQAERQVRARQMSSGTLAACSRPDIVLEDLSYS